MLVLSEKVITGIFSNLSPSDVLHYQQILLKGLAEYESNNSLIPPRVVQATEYGCTHLFMTSMGSRVGMKAITGSKMGFNGITTILDRETGSAKAVINGSTLTAFRTALANSLGLVKYYPIDKKYNNEMMISFGVGDQSLWHIKLSLILYPGRFKSVICVNRTLKNGQIFCDKLKKEFPNTEFISTDKEGLKNINLETCGLIWTCIPIGEPTVTKDITDKCAQKLFIGAIGSYKPHMIEVSGEVLNEALKYGKILVDSKEHCLHEAGEFIQNNIKEDSLIELCEVYTEKLPVEGKLVVSKLVGLCIMDVWVGEECLNQAIKEGLGIDVDF
ncbi:hypothetical protein DAMA08_038270 [Martiniozyma asiatica (nom. inval.)]|nr:hypothetical protein DAMA08_038270 [Martiniozyma asiatica]